MVVLVDLRAVLWDWRAVRQEYCLVVQCKWKWSYGWAGKTTVQGMDAARNVREVMSCTVDEMELCLVPEQDVH